MVRRHLECRRVAFLLLAAVLWWRDRPQVALALLIVGGTLVGAGLLVPGRLGPVHAAWMKLALVLSRVTTPIFMSIMYFVVIAPIGLLVRLGGRNPIVRREANGSYWITRPEGSRRSDLKRQF